MGRAGKEGRDQKGRGKGDGKDNRDSRNRDSHGWRDRGLSLIHI